MLVRRETLMKFTSLVRSSGKTLMVSQFKISLSTKSPDLDSVIAARARVSFAARSLCSATERRSQQETHHGDGMEIQLHLPLRRP